MSLASILTTAGVGLADTQFQIAVTNANVANASDPTYSRKTYASTSYVTQVSALSQGQVTRAANAYLARTVAQSTAASGRDAVIGQYLGQYDTALGSVGGTGDLSSLTGGLQSALSALAASPDSASAKTQALNAAAALATGLSGLSGQVQALRTQADQQIGQVTAGVNGDLGKLASLNDQIVRTASAGGDVSDLEDQRDAALTDLSSMIGVSSYVTADNRLVVYDEGGDLLLGSRAANLSYTPSSSLSATATYPGQIGGIMLDGKDVTGAIRSGSLGGLISLRDGALVGEQAKLDQFADVMIGQTNAVAAKGAAYPPPNVLTSDVAVTAGDPFSGTGKVRVAVLGADGSVSAVQDIDLSAFTTVSGLMAALNGVPGLSASITASGRLQLGATNPTSGVALAPLNSSVGSGGASLPAWFGFNDLFSGTGAGDIKAAATATTLPTGALDASAGLAVGARGLASGDATTVQNLGAALTAQVPFAAAGGFPAQTATLQAYAAKVVSSAAQLASDASSTATTSKNAADYAKSSLQNETAVNLDEENTFLVQLQNQYAANAQLIAAAKDLFQVLLTMMQSA
ncbi:MAG: flagellar hook-associated protein FlgK [Caulobacteraceae bacterium]|nr:flagellar hook-associated protein FlgK [Caulobacteraceae bacterium]